MRILVTGSRGFIGSHLVPWLAGTGQQVTRVVRGNPSPGDVVWDPERGLLTPRAAEGFDAVIHLAGENIAAGRWTAAKKARIRASRADGTRRLCESLAALARRPAVLVCASASGYYGDRGQAVLREESAAGTGFLAEVCQAWEAATEPAGRAGIRVVILRLGAVLSPDGGMLAKLLLPFRLGLGGRIGSGTQALSWITLDDALGAIQHVLVVGSLRGPVNGVAPNPVTNAEFTATLGRVLRRPTACPVPAAAARLLFGELADALLLASARVEPTRLLATGYRFRFPDLEGALRHAVGRG